MSLHDARLPRLLPARAAAGGPGPRHVTILLALRNGAPWIGAQLDSLAWQSHADWSLLVADDRSTDGGPAAILAFAAGHPRRRIRLVPGAGAGYAANFLSLLTAAGPDTPYAAFCDQDDVWRSGKLARALDRLAGLPQGEPAIWCSRTLVCGPDLSVLGASPLFRRPPTFRNALVQSIAGGNTMVANRAALDLLQRAAGRGVVPVSHDWWAYQVTTGAGGRVIYDPEPSVLYRQHGGNLVGANRGPRALLTRAGRLLAGDFRDWNRRNIAALRAAGDLLTEENRRCLAGFAAMREAGPLGRLRALRHLGLYRQTVRGTLSLRAAALIGRL